MTTITYPDSQRGACNCIEIAWMDIDSLSAWGSVSGAAPMSTQYEDEQLVPLLHARVDIIQHRVQRERDQP
jgi:hypothetical protein